MSAETAILLADVSKRFKFSTDEAESILDAIISSVRRKSHRHEQILWAVKDVSFSVQSGESVALVGLNGSGKSTILKLAAGIMRPSDGRIEVRGRLSALLELGAGFHPDLTGQENIWLNASILGLTNAEIGEIYDQIVDFSELGEFINMPVKHYSSGMYMRLGFSVAVHIDPDVLLIDEILAVGDQSFQDKCVERLAKLKAAGTTVVFVSHNPATVLSLCERAIWIEDGQMVADGPSQEIVRDYLASQESRHDESPFEAPEMPPISGDIELVGIRLCGASGRDQDVYEVGEEMTIEVDYLAQRPADEVEFDLSFRREDGAYAGGPTGLDSDLGPALDQGRGTVRCRIDTLPLPPAAYHISASVFAAGGQTVHDHRERLATFQVIEAASGKSGELLRIPATWESISRSAEPLVEAPAAAASGAAGLGAGGISSETNS